MFETSEGFHVAVCKADPITRPVEDYLIHIVDPLPSQVESAGERPQVFRRDACLIYEALIRSLPQGTIDQLTFLLLERTATRLRVAMPNDADQRVFLRNAAEGVVTTE